MLLQSASEYKCPSQVENENTCCHAADLWWTPVRDEVMSPHWRKLHTVFYNKQDNGTTKHMIFFKQSILSLRDVIVCFSQVIVNTAPHPTVAWSHPGLLYKLKITDHEIKKNKGSSAYQRLKD